MKIIMTFEGQGIVDRLFQHPLAQTINQRDLAGTQAIWAETPDHTRIESHTEFTTAEAYHARDEEFPQRRQDLADLVADLAQQGYVYTCYTDIPGCVEVDARPITDYQQPRSLMRL